MAKYGWVISIFALLCCRLALAEAAGELNQMTLDVINYIFGPDIARHYATGLGLRVSEKYSQYLTKIIIRNDALLMVRLDDPYYTDMVELSTRYSTAFVYNGTLYADAQMPENKGFRTFEGNEGPKLIWNDTDGVDLNNPKYYSFHRSDLVVDLTHVSNAMQLAGVTLDQIQSHEFVALMFDGTSNLMSTKHLTLSIYDSIHRGTHGTYAIQTDCAVRWWNKGKQYPTKYCFETSMSYASRRGCGTPFACGAVRNDPVSDRQVTFAYGSSPQQLVSTGCDNWERKYGVNAYCNALVLQEPF